MLLKIVCTACLFLIYYSISLSQAKILKYDDNGSEIKLHVQFELYDIKGLNSVSDKTFPRRTIFIGVPYGNDNKISYEIRKKTDSNIELQYLIKNKFPDKLVSQEKILECKGYLWIKNIYCIHLELNQIQSDLSQVEEIEINIKLIEKYNRESGISYEKISKNKVKYDLILNYSEALKYAVDRAYIDLSDTTYYWINSNKKYIKIKTATNEVYRIRFEDLSNLIPELSYIDPGSFNLYQKGTKYPVYIYGEEDHKFNTGDYIEFLGQRNREDDYRLINTYNEPYNEYINRYSDTTVFWLTWNDEDAERVSTTESSICWGDTLEYYPEIIHSEENNWFDFSTDLLLRKELPFWIENKTWNWHSLGTGTSSYNFQTSEVYKGKTARLFAKLQSFASEHINNSHLLAIGLNDYQTVYDSGYINKFERKILRASLNSDLMIDGFNKLKVFSYPTSALINSVFMDWYEIEYPRKLTLVNDSLTFRFDYLVSRANYNVKISGLSDQNFIIWKKGEYQKKFLNILKLDDFGYFSDSICNNDYFYIIPETRVKKPVIEKPSFFPNLRDSSRQADYIIITHKNFYSTAIQYKNFLKSIYELNAAVIDVEDIYNEYSYGYFNPESIKDFLKSTHIYWKYPLPEYVFLVGDGTYDYHRNRAKNPGTIAAFNYVPSYGAPVSDNWFITWDTTGAYYPMMNIGRLPVKTNEEFLRYFNRHKEYKIRTSDDWNKRYLFISGGLGNNKSELDKLKTINDNIINDLVIPAGGKAVHFYKTLNPVSSFGPFSSSEIQNGFDSSGLFISYIGHSGTQTWDNSIVDPSQIRSTMNRYPLVTDFGCSTGKFAEPDVNSFAELFINGPEAHAIAYIGNSSLGFLTTSTLFPYIFYKKILEDSIYNISNAHKLAKVELLQSYGTSEVYRLFALTNTFFGDPVISIPIPEKPDIAVMPSSIKIVEKQATDRMDSITCNLTFYNFGRVSDDSVELLITDEFKYKQVYRNEIKVKIPDYTSEITFKIPIKEKAGNHKIRVSFNDKGLINEIQKNNNNTDFNYFVSSSYFRLLDTYSNESCFDSSIIIINPPFFSNGLNMILECSRSPDFLNPVLIRSEIKTFISEINLKERFGTGRMWIRCRMDGDSIYSFSRSVYIGSKSYLLNDSASFSEAELKNLTISDNKIIPDSGKIIFTVISAGYNDGKTAVISKDGQSYIPGGNVIGHHVCLFLDSTYEFIQYRRFNVYGGGEEETKNYYRFLDSLTSKYLVFIAVNDEGRVVDSLKRKLHEFGSIYIDSLRFRSSWALAGKRGAARGSVPEGYSHAFQGKVQVDTIVKTMIGDGNFTTTKIGCANAWDKIYLNCSSYDTSQINLNIIGIKGDVEKDIVTNAKIQEDGLNINHINSSDYPEIKVHCELKSKEITLSSLRVKYIGYPELLIKYEIPETKIISGEKTETKISVFNAGECTASKIHLVLSITDEKNITDTILSREVAQLPSMEEITFHESFTSSAPGVKILNACVDSHNEVREVYEDNNIFSSSVLIHRDTLAPSLDITFDGREVFEGDFVSSLPLIEFSLSDNSFLSAKDTSYLKIYLDDVYVNYSNLESELIYGDRLKIIYSPHLDDGEHLLKVFACDGSGNVPESEGESLRFFVSDECRLLDVYNYPNPLSDNTYFTFHLTKVPAGLKIKIYTAAGRLIKQISKYPSDLHTGFNKIFWDARDEDGSRIANGIYFYKIIINGSEKNSSVTGKMGVVR